MEHVANVYQTSPAASFRWVDGVFDGGGPRRCVAALSVAGWWRDGRGVWIRVQACSGHAAEVSATPG